MPDRKRRFSIAVLDGARVHGTFVAHRFLTWIWAAAAALSLFLPPEWAMYAAFLFGTMAIAWPTAVRITMPATCELVAPGLVRIGWRRIRARDVEAATSAKLETGASIMLKLRGSTAPLILELESKDDSLALLECLGVGDSGAGSAIELRGGNRMTVPILEVLAVFALTLGVVSFVQGPGTHMSALGLFVASGVLAVAVGGSYASRPRLRLTKNGIEHGNARIAYRDIKLVSREARTIDVVAYDGQRLQFPVAHGDPGAPNETRHLTHHVFAAARRAQRAMPAKADPPRVLAARTSGREWVDALDAAAPAVGQPSGYRVEAIDPSELEAIVRDGDRSPDIRAAAARLLLKSGADPVRIEEALATLHGPKATEHARVVAGLDEADADEVAAALEELSARAKMGSRS